VKSANCCLLCWQHAKMYGLYAAYKGLERYCMINQFTREERYMITH